MAGTIEAMGAKLLGSGLPPSTGKFRAYKKPSANRGSLCILGAYKVVPKTTWNSYAPRHNS
jgi:hypothetical protein